MNNSNRKRETCCSLAVRALENDLTLLAERCRRLHQLEEDPLSWITYLEAVIVQLRALACERGDSVKKNFTIQGALIRLGCVDLKERFDQFLDSNIKGGGTGCTYTYRKAIKTIADKFICHHDNYDNAEYNNAVQPETYQELVAILMSGAIHVLAGTIIETVRQALEQSMEGYNHDLICRLFGSQEEYERVSKIEWPRAD